ncbi:hypothetical protein BDV96DRAFT_576287 [Lophiotrema nucula]|uniref:Secreted protein n=1 Tax=Lophiotrema nucula TaxID=690887 RepID=A0A6A5Z9A4_9PLEO|nr:hypothetical protein BDV96DRAFT_576287 [Lophiotrema nucula]
MRTVLMKADFVLLLLNIQLYPSTTRQTFLRATADSTQRVLVRCSGPHARELAFDISREGFPGWPFHYLGTISALAKYSNNLLRRVRYVTPRT